MVRVSAVFLCLLRRDFLETIIRYHMQNTKRGNLRWFLSALGALSTFCLGMWSCEFPESSPYGNTLPETRLANIPPNDTIAVYLRLGVIPEFTLYWLGDDPDGYVIAFRYWWTTFPNNSPTEYFDTTTILNITNLAGQSVPNYVLAKGSPSSLFNIYNFLVTLTPEDQAIVQAINDSLATLRPFVVPYKTGIVSTDSLVGGSNEENVTPNKGVFIFSSLVDSNMHRFDVQAIDNNDAADITPARVHFWTKEATAPIALIRIPGGLPPAGGFVIRYPTERWPGLRFLVQSQDPSTSEQEFSWTVDDTSQWSDWSESDSIFVTALDIPNVAIVDTHYFWVRARNRWGVISPPSKAFRASAGQGAAAFRDTFFTCTLPAIDDPSYHRVLVILNHRTPASPPAPLPSPSNPDSTMMRQFYSEILDSVSVGRPQPIQYDIRVASANIAAQFPSRRELGNYSAIIMVSEQVIAPIGGGNWVFSGPSQLLVREYLNIGGKLIYSSGPNIGPAISNYPASGFPSPGTWSYDVFHISAYQTNSGLDFMGGRGVLPGYPDFTLDPIKVPTDSLNSLRAIARNLPRGFAEPITLFNSRTDNSSFENQPLGVRFLAPPPDPPAGQTYSMVWFGFPLYYAEKSAAIQMMRQAFDDINE